MTIIQDYSEALITVSINSFIEIICYIDNEIGGM